MSTTAADLLVDAPIERGVQVVFGIPGDGVNGVLESLRTRREKIRFVQTRHEETAAFDGRPAPAITGMRRHEPLTRLKCCTR